MGELETDRQTQTEEDIMEELHISDFNIGAPVFTLLGACCLRVSAGTG